MLFPAHISYKHISIVWEILKILKYFSVIALLGEITLEARPRCILGKLQPKAASAFICVLDLAWEFA